MKKIFLSIITIAIAWSCSNDDDNSTPATSIDANFEIVDASATYNDAYEQVVMTINVSGNAGATTPTPVGQLDGAPVLGYVFPTTLTANDVGFGNAEGIVAMALTSHPDFDDTPLWDENNDNNYANDGVEWHSHWVLLVSDERVEGGLSVRQFEMGDPSVELPPTNPGMPMYMDSPGFQVVTSGNAIRVVIPKIMMNNKTSFNFDAVSALMQVNTSDADLPMLGVYEVYDVASGDLSLPYQVN